MRPIVVFSSVVVSAVVIALATALVLPAMAGAQASQVQAQSITIVTADGKPVLRLSATPLGTGLVQVLAADGSVRVAAQTGGRPDLPDPLSAGLNVFYAGSVGNSLAARIGQEAGNGPGGPNPEFQLLDRAHNIRFKAALDDDGNASIQLLNADGTVVWSAP
jgi:hypothetical protein